MTIVKGTGKRAEKARLTRRKILDAAHRLFVEHGYGTTTLKDVADEAGVAVQTIYFVFGNKRTLVKELVDVTIAGDDEPVPTLGRDWFQEAVEAETGQELLERFVEGTSGVLARVAPILKVIATAAATDQELAAEWDRAEDPRYTVITRAATAFLEKPGARKSLTVEEAADRMFGLLSPELYQVMVADRGWDEGEWQRWTLGLLRSELCE
ncbi:TetR/AcrR family transcriptional regulator [Glycomyces buryatensis]|uniref:TetR/AcrR family transcriptional regulator n=1 Tax=Glycomyces buryatensis TaxID=2570927 RepID=A0A4S8QI81_9ACTN|nr:TetR/AcrR family transcriptional regulator [Glycomyces buryatensis]THV41099.1 TetR/AcrR family transcriptional regulator [Glycomyces buryatensis]